MSAGLDHARGDNVALMHADLQDPPELLPEMLAAVRGRRRRRLRPADRAGRERRQARARHRLLRADAPRGPGALPGSGGRLPGDVAPGGRGDQADARAAPLPARAGGVGRLSSRCRSSTAGRAGTPAAAPPIRSCSVSRSRRWRRSRTSRCSSRRCSGSLIAQLSALGGVRDPRAHAGRSGEPQRLGVGARGGAVPVRGAADHRGHPRPVHGARPRRGAGPAAVPGRHVERSDAVRPAPSPPTRATRAALAATSEQPRRRGPTASARRGSRAMAAARRCGRSGSTPCCRWPLFGVPVIGHLGSRIVASDPIDSSQFMWFFAWWPHALLHGLNPFVTHAMFVPEGFNLTWATAMPGPSIAARADHAGIRPGRDLERDPARLAGAQRLDGVSALPPPHRPALPSLVGGYMFGFSPYMLIHLTGGPYLALVPLLPVFVLLVLRRWRARSARGGSWSRWRWR